MADTFLKIAAFAVALSAFYICCWGYFWKWILTRFSLKSSAFAEVQCENFGFREKHRPIPLVANSEFWTARKEFWELLESTKNLDLRPFAVKAKGRHMSRIWSKEECMFLCGQFLFECLLVESEILHDHFHSGFNNYRNNYAIGPFYLRADRLHCLTYKLYATAHTTYELNLPFW